MANVSAMSYDFTLLVKAGVLSLMVLSLSLMLRGMLHLIMLFQNSRWPLCAGIKQNFMFLRRMYVFKAISFRYSFNGGVPVIISRPAIGDFSLTGPSLIRAHLWICLESLSIIAFGIACAHMCAAYDILGLITALYSQWVSFGLGPQFLPMALMAVINWVLAIFWTFL